MKKAIVIGATSGIGKGLAELLVENGYTVGITGRRIAFLLDLKEQNPSGFIVKSFDVTNTTSSVQNLEELVHELGGLDLVIISSGFGELNKELDFSIEKRIIETNVIGYTCIADWTFNYFKKQNFGHLVGISSIGGLRGSQQAPAYNATKAYQINYLEGLRFKAKTLTMPITVTDIRPGFVDTDMAIGEGQFWVSTVEKAARQIFSAIKKKRKVVYVSKRWRIIAAFLKLF